MPAKDIYHDNVRNSLIKDGWMITHDPLVLKWGWKDQFVDLGAQRLIAAEKGQQKIAVEVKSFTGPSDMVELERALGQYVVYHDVLAEREPDRVLYLAITEETMKEVFEELIASFLATQLLLKHNRARLIVFDPSQEVILQWID
ncbi:fatty-acid synthase [Candidatus Poribacteria bacterium]|nr:fatty-acid synthase [Candidatus Poribacteria bacterium]